MLADRNSGWNRCRMSWRPRISAGSVEYPPLPARSRSFRYPPLARRAWTAIAPRPATSFPFQQMLLQDRHLFLWREFPPNFLRHVFLQELPLTQIEENSYSD